MQQDDPDPVRTHADVCSTEISVQASRQGCTDLLRAALVQLKLVHKAVAEGGPLQELVQACVTAVEAFVEVAKVVVRTRAPAPFSNRHHRDRSCPWATRSCLCG